MADKEQLEILKQGVVVWNQWRMDNSDKDADLSGAKLIGANFNGADLSDTYLNGAYLQDIIFKNTKYNKATKWPAGFDPKKIKGLVLCD